MGYKSSTESVRVFKISDLVSLQLSSASNGNQRKWYLRDEQLYIKEALYFQEKYWKDYLVEIIAYELSKQINCDSIEVVAQSRCIIDYDTKLVNGVYSKDFAKANNGRVVPLLLLDRSLITLDTYADVDTRWQLVLDSVRDKTGLDLTEYLIIMSILDYLVGNENRHLNNLSVLATTNGFKLAPLSDFGLGLFEHNRVYEHCSFMECIEQMKSKPFSTNNQDVMDYVDKRYGLAKYIPKEIDLSCCEIPSAKAGSYLRNRCMHLGVELKGVN